MTGWADSEVLRDLQTGVLVTDWRSARQGKTLEVTSPASGEVVAVVADAGPEDASSALDAAAAAFEGWSRSSASTRAELLDAAYRSVLEIVEDLAVIICAEAGKTMAEARSEVAYGAQYLRWYAEEAVRIGGRLTSAPDGSVDILVERQPLGPCLLITPWNFPFAMAARKLAPALAAGNTAIVKPSELTPLATYVLVDVLVRAGLPAGVLSLMTSSTPAELCEGLISDSRLAKVSFTGSTPVGRLLHEQASEHFAKLSLELGGDAPAIVFDDADLDRAVDGVMTAKFRNSGQSCVAANRILVHEPIAEEFADRLADRISALVVADGFNPRADVGAVIDERARAKCAAIVDRAVADGAVLQVRGEVPSTGTFVPATLVTDVPLETRVLGEEIFGPVAMLSRFGTEQEAILEANRSPYGLASYVFTQDIDRGRRVPRALQTGMVGVNTGSISTVAAPFGGIKSSGIGREGGAEGIEEYMNLRFVAVGCP